MQQEHNSALLISRHLKSAPDGNALAPTWTYHVEVCAFTFRFNSLEQVEEYLNYYRQKIHPSSADGADGGQRFYTKTATGGRFWDEQRGRPLGAPKPI